MFSVAVAGEDEAHRILAEKLVDGACACEDLDQRRRFVGDGQGASFLNLTRRPARERAPSGRPRYRSQRDGPRPLGFAAVYVEAAAILAQHADVVAVLQDEDGDASRRAALSTAAASLEERGYKGVALGLCNPTAEAWLVALIAASRPGRAEQLRRKLGFNPETRPENLSSRPRSHPRHAKRALHFLLDEAQDDLVECPADTPDVGRTGPALAAVDLKHAAIAQLENCGLAPCFFAIKRAIAQI